MAESVVVQPPQRFFCHLCNVEIENVSSEYTCPLCAGGFIEELPPAAEQPNISEDIEMGNDYDTRLTEHISSLLMNSLADVRPMDDDSDQSSTQDGGSGSTSTGNSSYGPRRTRNRRLLTHRQDSPTFDNIMHEFMISITGGGIGGAVGNGANGPMFFMGNPGDYAWGREGLDTVITQMLNQMENSGPPPLSKEKIQDIPRVEIDDEQVDRKLQCSVCWDDFEKQETVRKLPCTHIYHENCIVPWLQLHGTCPVCRKTVDKETAAGEQQQQQSQQQPQQHTQQLSGLNISNRLGQVYRALNYLQGDNESVSSVSSDGFADQTPFISTTSHPQQQHQQSNAVAQPHQTPSSSSSSSTSIRSNSQPPHQASSDNNLASRRDDDGNVEFDFD